MGTDVHFVFLFSFDELARQRNEVGTKLWSFFVWGEKRSVEDTVHLPGQREMKAIGIG